MKNELSPTDGIKFMPSFPTVLIGSGTGNDSNILTAGMIHIFSTYPPMLGTGIAPERHSFDLIDDQGEFTVNVPDKEMLQEVKNCGSSSGSDVDKFEEFNLTKEQSKEILVPGVQECPLIFECKIKKKIETGNHYWFVGKVVNAKKKEGFKRENTILYWGGEFRTPGERIE